VAQRGGHPAQRGLQLAQHHCRSAAAQRGADLDVVEAGIGAGDDDDPVRAGRVDADQGDAARSGDHDHPTHVDPAPTGLVEQEGAQVVLADAADHARARPGPGSGDRLVQPLAAGLTSEGGAVHGLAVAGQALGVSDQISIQAAHHHDLVHEANIRPLPAPNSSEPLMTTSAGARRRDF
jgi:hypothetical protein